MKPAKSERIIYDTTSDVSNSNGLLSSARRDSGEATGRTVKPFGIKGLRGIGTAQQVWHRLSRYTNPIHPCI